MLSNKEILEKTLESGLLKRCMECQFKKLGSMENYDDFFQDMCLIILEKDNEKLNNAYENHWNAYLTAIIKNNIFSLNSPYYTNYIKFKNITVDYELDENNEESGENDWD